MEMGGNPTCNLVKYGYGAWGYSYDHIKLIEDFWASNNKSKGCPYSCLAKDDEDSYNYHVVDKGKRGL
jgi:hypothetical protein